MKYTFPVTKEMVKARSTLSVSKIHAHTVCKAINKKKFKEAKEIIEGLASEKTPLGKRFYTKTSSELLKFLNILESNAGAKNLDPNEMNLFISVHRGPTLMRSRRKWRFGREMKICHVQAILKGEKSGTGKKVHSTVNKKSSN